MRFQKDGMTLGCLVVALVVAHYRRTTQVPEIAIYLRTYLHASFQRTVDFACIQKFHDSVLHMELKAIPHKLHLSVQI